MKYAVLFVALLGACDEDKPDTAEVAKAKEECKALLEHIVTISPQGEGKNPKEVVAALPIEDLQACAASDPRVLSCMSKATNVDGIKACPLQVECADKAIAARAAARKKANSEKGTPELDRPFDEAAAKCLAGDLHAADKLVASE